MLGYWGRCGNAAPLLLAGALREIRPSSDPLGMTARTRTTIFNAALLRTGNSDTIEGEGGALWRAMEANYDEIVRNAFETGTQPYPFGKGRVTLTSRSDGTFGYDDAYTMPPDVIQVIEVYLDGYKAADLREPWELDMSSSKLLVNAAGRTVEVAYIKEGLEHTWSAAFALGVQRALEAVIKDVLEETQEALFKDQAAEDQMRKAGVVGARQKAKTPVWKRSGGRLIRARRGQR